MPSSRIIVCARPKGGYWGHGRHWPVSNVELEIVDQPEAEKILDFDGWDDRKRKQALRETRIRDGKVTPDEVERIKADAQLAEVVVPPCALCPEREQHTLALQADLASVRAELDEAKADIETARARIAELEQAKGGKVAK